MHATGSNILVVEDEFTEGIFKKILQQNAESEIYISSPFVNCVCYKSLQVHGAFDIFYTTSVLERPWDENIKGSFAVQPHIFHMLIECAFLRKNKLERTIHREEGDQYINLANTLAF